MEIGSLNKQTNTYNVLENKKVNKSDFSNTINNTSDPILDYYHDLCSKYPDVSFRLDDVRTGMINGRCLGYKDSMNQVGDNFGCAGQCSISIDVKVIENMMQDSSYEISAKGWIEDSISRYSQYEKNNQLIGMEYTSVHIEDDNSRVSTAIVGSHLPYSTEEEVKAIWNSNNEDKNQGFLYKKISDNVDMFDSLMEIFDKSQNKQKEIVKKYYNADELIEKTDKRNKNATQQKRATVEYDKHILME